MRKVKIFSALLAILTLLFLVACGSESETPDGGAGNADNSTHVHAPKSPVQENYTSATCTEGAHYDSVVYCADCGAELERNKFTVSDPLGHTPKSAVEENRVAATCAENGSYDSVVYCKVCGDELSRSKIKIARNQSHTMSGGKCSVCDLPESSAGLEFSLNSDGKSYTVTGLGSCESTDIVIGVYKGLSVTTIGDYAFWYCSSLTSVVIPDSVTTIGECAFSSCSSLTSVTVGNGVTTIGSYAFSGCSSLTSVYITDIAAWCGIEFSSSSNPLSYAKNLYVGGTLVKDLVIPDSVTTIGSSAFESCDSLTSVTIGNSVTTIGNSAFSSCASLTSVVIPDSVTTIGNYAFYWCTSLTSVVIPDSVTTIGDWAFYDCKNLKYNEYDNAYYLGNENNPYLLLVKAKSTSITSVTIHKDTRFIHSSAFYDCYRLTSVTIGNSVTTIGDRAFYYCYNLTSAVIPDSVTFIGAYAFYGCDSLRSIKYRGTSSQWNSISKGENWNKYFSVYGEYVTISYTMTYNYTGE